MSLEKCRECGASVSSRAPTCPRCGAKDPTTNPVAVYGTGLAILVAILAWQFLPLVWRDSDAPSTAATQAQISPEPPSEHSDSRALIEARDFVKARLKAPRTAKWPGLFATDEKVTHLGDGTYAILSYVDAENTFGAMVRTHYVCKVRYVGEGEWRLEELDMYQ